MASSSLPSPEGLLIGNTSRKSKAWRIGKKLGSGACGMVHELTNETGNSYAIKLVPLPDRNSRSKANKEIKRNADLLYFEHLMYTAQLSPLQGDMIPAIPLRGPPIYGDQQGYRYLVMEKMEMTLMSALLLSSSKRKKWSLTLGKAGIRLVDILEAVHERRNLVIDIKPENFMVAPTGRICLLDLALLQQYNGAAGAHRTDEGCGTVVGTPLYVSLHMQEHHTPSRRDDVQALFYVLAECRLRQLDQQLPWAKGNSDQEIFDKKKETMTKHATGFFASLGNGNERIGQAFCNFFNHVQSLSFSGPPDYARLRGLCHLLDEEEETRGRKRAPRTCDEAPRKKTHLIDSDEEGQESNYGTATLEDDATGFFTCAQEDENHQMDWEFSNDDRKRRTDKKDRFGVRISVTEGPCKGEHVDLVRGEQEEVVVGSSDEGAVLLQGDANSDPFHALLSLPRGRVKKVAVKDLSSKAATMTLRGKTIRKGREEVAFISDKMGIGRSTLMVRPLPLTEEKTKKQTMPVESTSTKKPKKQTIPVESTTKKPKKQTEATRIVVAFIEGPDAGKSVALQPNKTDSLVVGSNPRSTRSGASFAVKDAALDPSHVRLELDASKKTFVSVWVTARAGGVLIGKRALTAGKSAMAFRGDTISIGESTRVKLK